MWMKKLSEVIPILRTGSIVRHQIDNLFYNEDPDLAHYIDKRLKPKIRYYEIKARNNQLGFKSSKGLIIILSLVVSLSNAAVFGQDSIPVQTASVLASSIVIAITVFLQFTNPQENWILFRSTAEKLKREYFLFKQDVKPYSDINGKKNKAKVFVENLENIMSEEGIEYFQSLKSLTMESGTTSANAIH
jgi:ABC-type multidrug transport system fused ATPase/permease subunit